MRRLRITWSSYRSPVLAGLILMVGATIWGWQQRQAELNRERHTMIRHALSLSSGLAVLVEQIDMAHPTAEERLRSAVATHLRVRPPMIFAAVHRGDRIVVRIDAGAHGPPGGPPNRPGHPPPGPRPGPGADHEHPGHPPPPALSGDVQIIERSLGPACADTPQPPPTALWSWESATSTAAACPQMTLVVGVDAGFPAEVLDPANRRFVLAVLLVWLAIGALLFAWVRSIKSRTLRAELNAERRERSILSDMNLAGAGLAHETKNPLGIIFGLAQRLAQDPAASDRQHEIAEQIIDEADRATARLGEFIQFARVPDPVMVPTRLDLLIDSVLAVLQADFDDREISIERVGAACTVACDANMMQQLIVNLLLNGLQASDAGSAMQVGIHCDGSTATMDVCDGGRGIPATLRADIFKPYVTGRADGHGLGLAIVKRIVDQHRWTIDIADRAPTGTQIRVSGLTVLEGEST